MKTEQDKYNEAWQKTLDLKQCLDQMQPETKRIFLQEFVKVTGAQQLLAEIYSCLSNDLNR